MRVVLDDDRLTVGRFSVELVRTLRVPAQGRYPLPPALGTFPLHRVKGARDVIVPFYQFEAMWLRFSAAAWKPSAVQIATGGVNALTGERFPAPLRREPQNYVVCPLQPWLDGYRVGEGIVRQFVAAPLGRGVTVQEQRGRANAVSLHLRVYEPRRGVFPSRRPRGFEDPTMFQELPVPSLELGAGGVIEQDLAADPYGPRTWDPRAFTDIRIQIVNSAVFRALTGRNPPPSPISAADYTRAGLPWFRYFDDDARVLKGEAPLGSLSAVDAGDAPVAPRPIRTIRRTRRR